MSYIWILKMYKTKQNIMELIEINQSFYHYIKALHFFVPSKKDFQILVGEATLVHF